MDFVTLLTCCAVAEACLATALMSSGYAKDRPGWQTWALSLAMRAGAYLLYVMPVFVVEWTYHQPTQFAAVLLILVSAAVSMKGTTEFLGLSAPRVRDLAPLVAIATAYVLAFAVFDSPRWRIATVSTGLAFGLGWSNWKIVRQAIGSAPERRFVVAALSLWVVILLVRAVNVLALPTAATATAISVASLQPWFFIGYLIAVITTVVGLIGLRSSVITGHLEESRAEAERRVNTDMLTGLMSRAAVLGEAQRMFVALHASKESKASMSILMLDCDHFKSINDRFGHFVGDLALKELGNATRKVLPAGAVAGRFGGEEFIVLLPSELVPASLDIAQALRLAVRGINLESGRRKVALSISIGAATSAPEDQTVQDILNRADAALLQAKTKGRDQVVSGFATLGSYPPPT